MGVYYDSLCVFGYELSYRDIYEKLGNDTSDMLYRSEYNIHTSSSDFDLEENECRYFLGISLPYESTISNVNKILKKENEISKEMENFCKKVGIVYKFTKPMLYHVCDIN